MEPVVETIEAIASASQEQQNTDGKAAADRIEIRPEEASQLEEELRQVASNNVCLLKVS